MTRDEAVQKLVTAGRLSVAHAEDLYDSIVNKPVVPQYVADWYEENKDDFEKNLFYFSYDWFDNNGNAIQTLVNMHQFGYEIEKEKRYTVRFKGLYDKNVYLKSNLFRNFWSIEEDDFGCEGIPHTRKELEDAGFGWVFDCEGVEVKEVE